MRIVDRIKEKFSFGMVLKARHCSTVAMTLSSEQMRFYNNQFYHHQHQQLHQLQSWVGIFHPQRSRVQPDAFHYLSSG
ncbi:expressed protein [Echinococcus multilocularis]|uniref:Expressed protein n=1 Tax=Echinococcus multilocularis TaxID=6211 RepID=A0A068Y3V2_ECHMU|nr:expressed protein [Echinococcus multilocularis]